MELAVPAVEEVEVQPLVKMSDFVISSRTEDGREPESERKRNVSSLQICE